MFRRLLGGRSGSKLVLKHPRLLGDQAPLCAHYYIQDGGAGAANWKQKKVHRIIIQRVDRVKR